MNVQTISLQPAAAQQVEVALNKQPCTIRVCQRDGDIYVDLYVNGEAVVLGALARDRVGLTRHSHLPFKGELLVVDTHGTDDPHYTGFGERWLLAHMPEQD